MLLPIVYNDCNTVACNEIIAFHICLPPSSLLYWYGTYNTLSFMRIKESQVKSVSINYLAASEQGITLRCKWSRNINANADTYWRSELSCWQGGFMTNKVVFGSVCIWASSDGALHKSPLKLHSLQHIRGTFYPKLATIKQSLTCVMSTYEEICKHLQLKTCFSNNN